VCQIICAIFLNLFSFFLGFYARWNDILYPYSDSIEPHPVLNGTVSEDTLACFMMFGYDFLPMIST
jgi:ATP/ADP translocase